MIPIALTIAGSDSGGGAGIQADLKTFSAVGVYGACVITSLTAQNTRGVQAIHDVPAAFVRAQLDSVLSDLAISSVKIGMLSRPDTVAVVADVLAGGARRLIVLDPVMVATSGDRLLDRDAVAVLTERLMPLADLVTPNLPEAAAMLGEPQAGSEEDATGQAARLVGLGARAVLLKGGHADGPESVDLLVTRAGARRFASPRHPTRNTHGTGCTLSAAIAAGLAHGATLEEAVASAKRYVTAAIVAADRLPVGHGSGPVHHFHAWW